MSAKAISLETAPLSGRGARGSRMVHKLRRYPSFWIGAAILTVFAAFIPFAPQIATHDPTRQDLTHRLAEPSAQHWFGTDELGRDIFSRVIYGTRVSLPSSAFVVAVVVVMGAGLGAFAGFFGGLVGAAIMRVADVTMAFPGLVLALAIASLLGPSLNNMLIAACAVLWPLYARLMRSQVLVVRNQDYVLAARASGMRESAILWHHVLPNAITPILTIAAMEIGGVLLLLSALSFFGLGVDVNTPEWGAMIAAGQKKFLNWWLAAFPGAAVFIVILAFNLMSEGIRNIIDPYKR